MALTGTFEQKLTETTGWVQIANADAFCGGVVVEGSMELWFEVIANAPGKDSKGVPYRALQAWNYTVGALNAVWARSSSGATIRYHNRAS